MTLKQQSNWEYVSKARPVLTGECPQGVTYVIIVATANERNHRKAINFPTQPPVAVIRSNKNLLPFDHHEIIIMHFTTKRTQETISIQKESKSKDTHTGNDRNPKCANEKGQTALQFETYEKDIVYGRRTCTMTSCPHADTYRRSTND